MSICTEAAKVRLSPRPTWKQNAEQLARAWADHHGIHAHVHGGGWLYTRNEKPYIQGWSALADRLIASRTIIVGKGINWGRS